jgi:aryl-alcohol dehydrogenase-like predicted oxidoreductase
MNTTPQDTVPLGASGLQVSALGIGTWAWGDKFFWGYGKGGYDDGDLQVAFEAAIKAGVNFFDTAEVYGLGRSERLLGQFTQASQARHALVIATKFMPLPWRLKPQSLLTALKASLERLGLTHVDLYQIHQPLPPVAVETWAEMLAYAVEAGLVKAVGVSNYNFERTQLAYETLQSFNVPLASNQMEYSLVQRKIEYEGLLEYCQAKNISLIAYSPLGMGLLTGKYSPDNPMPGIRGKRFGPDFLASAQELLDRLRLIGQAHADDDEQAKAKTPAQVALNWAICKGTIPIPGAKNLKQATDNAHTLGWRLTEDEVRQLDDLSSLVQV